MIVKNYTDQSDEKNICISHSIHLQVEQIFFCKRFTQTGERLQIYTATLLKLEKY